MFENLSENNVFLYAARCYDKPNCIASEFEEDFKHFSYIKRLLKKYDETGDMKERLLLNHIVLLQNVFGILPSTRILFVKVEQKHYGALKPFLVYTSSIPEIIKGINGSDVRSSDILLDWKVVEKLRVL